MSKHVVETARDIGKKISQVSRRGKIKLKKVAGNIIDKNKLADEKNPKRKYNRGLMPVTGKNGVKF